MIIIHPRRTRCKAVSQIFSCFDRVPSPLGQSGDDHSEHFIVRSSCLFSICWVVTGLLVFAIKSVIYVLFNVKNAMFLPKRSLPICQ